MKETKKRTRLVKIIFIMPDKLIYITLFCWRLVEGEILSTVDTAAMTFQLRGQGFCKTFSAHSYQSTPHLEDSSALLTADGSSRYEMGDTILMYRQILRTYI